VGRREDSPTDAHEGLGEGGLEHGRGHRDVICRLGLPPCGSDEFISLKPSVEEHRLLDAAFESLAESGAADVKADVKK
jgi:hypothetical protein